MSIGETSSESSNRTMGKRSGKRPGRKSHRLDESVKLERSRQSARECRARKKLRYQYLEELVLHREKAVFALRDELETYKQWCVQLDTEELVPDSLLKMVVNEEMSKEKKQMEEANRSILQQQRHEESSQFSVSSSSTDSSPSPQLEHSQHQYSKSEHSQHQYSKSEHSQHEQSKSEHSQHQYSQPEHSKHQYSKSEHSQHQYSKSEHSQHEQSKSEHSQQQRHHQIDLEQSFKPQSSSHHQTPSSYHQTPSSSLISHRRNISPHRPQQHHQRQLSQRTERTTSLQRQMAFDESQSYEVQSVHPTQPAVLVPKTIPPMQFHSQSFDSATSILPQQHRVQQLLHQHYLQHLGAGSSSSAPQHYNIPTHVSQGPLQPVRTSVKSEPPLKYEHSVDRFQSLTNTGFGSSQEQTAGASLPASVDTRRGRSYSNPSSMMHFARSPSQATSTRSLPGSSRSLTTSHTEPGPSSQGSSSQGFGLFSGSLIGPNISPLILNIPASAAVEESSSSDENVNEQQLFHSSLILQKRTPADPTVPGSSKWSTHLRSIPSPVGTAASISDPQITLSNLTTFRCFSTTRTCNTPSPSSAGPSGLPSPIPVSKYAGTFTSTPSSSATTSPAPLSSLSSLLELSASSPGISSSTFSTHLGSADLHLPEHDISSSIADTLHCSATSLIASIDEPIPELYSFLADLEEGGMSSLTSRHGASSSHSTPLALTPKQQDQPSTPDPTYLNVPKIIDECLDSDTEDL